jgi:hypothetical protein
MFVKHSLNIEGSVCFKVISVWPSWGYCFSGNLETVEQKDKGWYIVMLVHFSSSNVIISCDLWALMTALIYINWVLLTTATRLSIYLSIYLSVCLSVCLSACLPACLPVCLSLPIHPSIHPSTYLRTYLPNLPTYLSIHPSTYLFIYLWLYSPLLHLGCFSIFFFLHSR